MKKQLSLIFCIMFIVVSVMVPCVSSDFVLPDKGCYMAHCNSGMSDCTYMQAPIGNVGVVWNKCVLAGERAGSKGLGFSGNDDIAVCTYSGLRDNLVVYDYDGNRIWASGDLLNVMAFTSAPIVDVHGRIIACDNQRVVLVDPLDYDGDDVIVEWISELPDGGLPFSPVITENGVIIVATDRGPVYAYDVDTGELIAKEYLMVGGSCGSLLRRLGWFFSTINTPAVKGNRVYISTECKLGVFSILHHARLYAIDVDREGGTLETAWVYEFGGPSGASPLLVNDTLYFDGGRIGSGIKRNPHIFAVTDMGDYGKEKWKVPIPDFIGASLVYDLCDGFWIIDHKTQRFVHRGMDDGRFIEEIDIDGIINEKGIHQPCSVITMYGNKTRPILITSATAIWKNGYSCYVIAIDSADDNSLLWKVKLSDGPVYKVDFPFGQFPALVRNGNTRIIFSSVRNGAWAIGNIYD